MCESAMLQHPSSGTLILERFELGVKMTRDGESVFNLDEILRFCKEHRAINRHTRRVFCVRERAARSANARHGQLLFAREAPSRGRVQDGLLWSQLAVQADDWKSREIVSNRS